MSDVWGLVFVVPPVSSGGVLPGADVDAKISAAKRAMVEDYRSLAGS